MKKAIIIGAGPAGLTAAYELLTKTDIIPIILEADTQVGGISKTINHNGNKIDIGGHRFFSKSDIVIKWWLQFLPLETRHTDKLLNLGYQNQKTSVVIDSAYPPDSDKVMLVRPRKSRIFYNQKLFEYPLKLNTNTIAKLGIGKTFKAGFSYLHAKLFPLKPEHSLEQFFINRFGRELYKTFFEDYTEKVWGVPCSKIPASWGQQRVKNLDVGGLLWHALKSVFTTNKSIDQKGTSTSLIEQFLYPKYGPGQMWETVAAEITRLGGTIILNTAVTRINGNQGNRILSVDAQDLQSGQQQRFDGDYFISTMPVREFIGNSHDLDVPDNIRQTVSALGYRDFLIVGLLADRLTIVEKDGSPISDNWIYIQDKNIRAGRLQFFHNWSPGMIASEGNKWIGVEYFCDESEPFWNQTDAELSATAIREMEKIGVLNAADVKDRLVVRVKKAYPSYYGAYKDFPLVQEYLNSIPNLFPVGRNGMHRYNNSDHSMLTAMAAVNNILTGRLDKSNIWEINTEEEYHEKSEKD